MGCVFCQREENYFSNGEKRTYRPGKDVNSFTCSRCIQRLLSMPRKNRIQAQERALKLGHVEKADALKSMTEESEDVSQTGKAGSNLVRKRPVRKAGLALNRVRA
jgi:hypothetical protein